MMMETATKLNYFPAKGGCSNYFSPREILHHIKLDCKKHCSMSLLSYVLAQDEPTLMNTLCTCALDCLFLCAEQNNQGGYECYHIPTHQVITHPYVTIIPDNNQPPTHPPTKNTLSTHTHTKHTHTNVLSFGNIAKLCPIQYLQQLDMFQVQLSNQINIFGYEQIDNLYALKGSQPRGKATKTHLTQAIAFQLQATSHVQTIKENSKFLTPKQIA